MGEVKTRACIGCGQAIPAITCKRRCDACQKASEVERRREQYQRNKDKYAQRHKVRYADNPERFRGYHYKHRYGITFDEVKRMHERQGGKCGICFKPIPFDPSVKRQHLAVVDHCHSTGKVRGILCRSCNLMIGNGRDRPDVLRRAAQYLEVA